MAQSATAVATVDRRPFFEKALRFGLQHAIIAPSRLDLLVADGPKGIVQIANHFGTAHLRTDLEIARVRMVNLVSLYLEDLSDGDLHVAAASLRDKSFLAHSKGGSDLLKMLHAMPDSTLIGSHEVSADSQKYFLNDATYAAPLALDTYRAERAQRQDNQRRIALACWLGRKLGVGNDDLQAVLADAVIRCALLVLFIPDAKLELPGATGLAKLLQAARKKAVKLDEARLSAFLADGPDDFQRQTRAAMTDFVAAEIPALRAGTQSVDALLHRDADGDYFINENVAEDLGEYDRLVAKEWTRVTKGDSDDPNVLATLFLRLATGQPPAASLLQREAKEVIQTFRQRGFDSKAVIDYIEAHAPHQSQGELKHFWQEDLRPEAEVHLADTDPEMPDTHMERALPYLRKTCNAAWKGRARNY